MQLLERFVFGFCIQSARGFIKDHDLRLTQKRSRQSNFLPLTGAEFLAVFKLFTQNRVVAVSQFCNRAVRSRVPGGRYYAFVPAGNFDVAKPDILSGWKRVFCIVLKDDADLLT